MNRDQIRLIETHVWKNVRQLPADTHGNPPIDDFRVIGAILHVLK